MAWTVAGVGATPAPTAMVSAGSWCHIAAWSRTSRRPAIRQVVPPTDGAVLCPVDHPLLILPTKLRLYVFYFSNIEFLNIDIENIFSKNEKIYIF